MDDDGEFGIVTRGSKISYGRNGSGKGHRLQRKGALNHVRDSVRSTRSRVLSRGSSARATAVPDEIAVNHKREETVQLEDITAV